MLLNFTNFGRIDDRWPSNTRSITKCTYPQGNNIRTRIEWQAAIVAPPNRLTGDSHGEKEVCTELVQWGILNWLLHVGYTEDSPVCVQFRIIGNVVPYTGL